MKQSTQCYIRNGDCCLLMLRNKKENDINQNKWIGIGGKKENGESILDCLKREVKEETGFSVSNPVYQGRIDFFYENSEPEEIYVYEAFVPERAIHPCDEGTLAWIHQDDLLSLEMWEGDRIFLERMQKGQIPFHLSLSYDKDDQLKDVKEYEGAL